MDDNAPDILPLVPPGLVRAWRWCSDCWAAIGTPEMAVVLLCCVLSCHLGPPVNGESPSEVAQTQQPAMSPIDRAWASIAALHEARLLNAMESHGHAEERQAKEVTPEATGG